MKAKIVIPILSLFIIIAIFLLMQNPREATLLLVNGVVYTVSDKEPIAQAIAVSGDRIVGVGPTDEIRSRFTSTRLIDLEGKPIYPGFTDSHAHLEGLGAVLMNLDLGGTISIEEVQKLVADRVKTTPAGAWVRGRGWDQNKWPSKKFPTYHSLDAVAKNVPVYLRRVDGHAAWVNSKVLELARVNKQTPDPKGGKILRDSDGNPTGIFVDNAMALLDSVAPVPTPQERTEAIKRALRECTSVGLTEVHDMGVDLEAISIYKKLIKEKRFPLRVYAAIDGTGETWNEFLGHGPEIGGIDGRLTIRALKLYADGALGSRGAALIEPYSDDPTNRGLTLTSSEELTSCTRDALDKGFQVCVHAIGDRANHMVLDAYERVFAANPSNGRKARFRIEHAQVLDAADIPRFQRLGVLPMMQPTHCTSDMYWAEDRLGAKRVAGAYAWRSLLGQGSIIPGGSDFPVESPNPLLGFYASITRQDQEGRPAGGWHPDQRMTREEALKAFTIWGAYAAFEETQKGSIETGKLADFVVLSDDIMKINPRQILSTRVVMTIVGGDVVYQGEKSGQRTTTSP